MQISLLFYEVTAYLPQGNLTNWRQSIRSAAVQLVNLLNILRAEVRPLPHRDYLIIRILLHQHRGFTEPGGTKSTI